MQIPPSEVAAPHLTFLVELGVLQLFCEDCHWPMAFHPIDWNPTGFMGYIHGMTNPQHCNGLDPYYSSRNFKHENPNEGGVHDCKHIKGEWGVDSDGVYRYIAGKEEE